MVVPIIDQQLQSPKWTRINNFNLTSLGGAGSTTTNALSGTGSRTTIALGGTGSTTPTFMS